eukprot:m.173819 g.173819  ORF g.173819 m.173819 type:complete len:342 (+) comp18310_c0_seq1:303-1328(+)
MQNLVQYMDRNCKNVNTQLQVCLPTTAFFLCLIWILIVSSLYSSDWVHGQLNSLDGGTGSLSTGVLHSCVTYPTQKDDVDSYGDGDIRRNYDDDFDDGDDFSPPENDFVDDDDSFTDDATINGMPTTKRGETYCDIIFKKEHGICCQTTSNGYYPANAGICPFFYAASGLLAAANLCIFILVILCAIAIRQQWSTDRKISTSLVNIMIFFSSLACILLCVCIAVFSEAISSENGIEAAQGISSVPEGNINFGPGHSTFVAAVVFTFLTTGSIVWTRFLLWVQTNRNIRDEDSHDSRAHQTGRLSEQLLDPEYCDESDRPGSGIEYIQMADPDTCHPVAETG